MATPPKIPINDNNIKWLNFGITHPCGIVKKLNKVIEREKNSIERFDLDDLVETRRMRGELTLKLIETAKEHGVIFDN